MLSDFIDLRLAAFASAPPEAVLPPIEISRFNCARRNVFTDRCRRCYLRTQSFSFLQTLLCTGRSCGWTLMFALTDALHPALLSS
jgi:hypothetical protein